MRIISGQLGGRQFSSPSGHRTHPMSDKVRGGLFNALGDIEGLSLLDAFAGSGAVSFEAVSRGATNVLAVDIDKEAHSTIQSNLQRLDLTDKIKAVRANVGSWSDNNPDRQFDLVICDPPYDKNSENLITKIIKHVKIGGLLVLSWPGNNVVPAFEKLNEIKTQNYGDAQLVFFKKTE